MRGAGSLPVSIQPEAIKRRAGSLPKVTTVGYQRLKAMEPWVRVQRTVFGSNFHPCRDDSAPQMPPPPPTASNRPSLKKEWPLQNRLAPNPVVASGRI